MSSAVENNRQINDLVERFYPALIQFREKLHRHPELSWQEFQTTENIITFLTENGIEHFSRPLATGVVTDLIFTDGAPFILLRADIDALPLQDEKTSVSYCSQNPGVCHACAHDAHTAVMAGTAAILKALSPTLLFNLRFVFQPAEEPIPSGAPEMIKNGVLQDVCCALGLHMEPRLPLETISLTPGWVNMQSNRLNLTLSGPGGHSARPSETADLLWLASRIIQDSYQIVYREINLLDSAVILTFTEIHAGEGYNVIPAKLQLTGTLRLSDPEKKQQFLEKFNRLLETLENESKSEITFEIQHGSPAVYNDPSLMAEMQAVLQHDFWLPYDLITDFKTPGGDDFSHYCQEIPGAMIKFGVRTPATTASLHEGMFDLPPASIKNAVSFFVHQLLNFKQI